MGKTYFDLISCHVAPPARFGPVGRWRDGTLTSRFRQGIAGLCKQLEHSKSRFSNSANFDKADFSLASNGIVNLKCAILLPPISLIEITIKQKTRKRVHIACGFFAENLNSTLYI